MTQCLVIGTRGSQLALTQTRLVRTLLLDRHPDLEVEISIIQTKGDITQKTLRSFGGQGVFTGELEHCLLAGQVDLAVHSLKDLPTSFSDDLVLAATPERADVRDVLIASRGSALDDLPNGACIGTGSLRRQAQLKALRPDLRFADIRGNLDTRIAKVENGEYDGIVLAAAGLHRLSWEHHIGAYLETDHMLPAVGQAALGLQMRRGDELLPLVAHLNHSPTFAAITAERTFLATLGGGCHAPIAAWARQEEHLLRIDGLVAKPDGTNLLRATSVGPPEDAVAVGQALGEDLVRQGADALLQEPNS